MKFRDLLSRFIQAVTRVALTNELKRDRGNRSWCWVLIVAIRVCLPSRLSSFLTDSMSIPLDGFFGQCSGVFLSHWGPRSQNSLLSALMVAPLEAKLAGFSIPGQ